MANSYEKHTSINTGPPIREHEEEENLNGHEDTVWGSGCGCGCFRLFCFERPRRSTNHQEDDTLLHQKGEQIETWLVNKLKKAKEVSEQLAGPNWKNMVRKISKYFNNKKPKTEFQYDPNSYALNFDDRVHGEEDGLLRNFSTRFATPFSDQQRQPRL